MPEAKRLTAGGFSPEARSLHIELQTALDPLAIARSTSFGWTFALGDKVCGPRTTTTKIFGMRSAL